MGSRSTRETHSLKIHRGIFGLAIRARLYAGTEARFAPFLPKASKETSLMA